jgi:2-polyprenyl-3-methyl-5-hydroxy-6-metoxy-1,4-benzoquinol methylase
MMSDATGVIDLIEDMSMGSVRYYNNFMRILSTIAQLDQELKQAHALSQRSDAEFRQHLGQFYVRLDTAQTPANPFSEAYRQFQLGIYEQIAQKPYALVNEESNFDFEEMLRWPFPYTGRSAQVTGEYLISYGFFIKMMNLPTGAKILEMGSGFGPLTLHLASLGYQVTCLDISQTLLNYVQRRTAQLPTPVRTICGDMTTAAIDDTFDAVVFYESFHHCLEHQRLLARLPALLKPNGLLAFAAEPIVGDDNPIVPYPWGLRSDGLSLWCIRRYGWLELGFRESYFKSLLAQAGWRVRRHRLGQSGLNDVWLAQRNNEPANMPAYEAASEPNNEEELARLRQLVAGYERGKFIRFTKWLHKRLGG